MLLRNSLLILISCLSFMATSSGGLFSKEERWNWDKIPFKNLSFPGNFIFGPADSALQTEGDETSNGKKARNSWSAWQEEIIIKNGIKQPRFPENQRMGYACHRWTLYKQDIQLAKQAGFNTMRFSIDWSKIEPEKGVFDADAMEHYLDYAREMIANGIQPIPTLFHHAWPLWFEYKNDPTRGYAFEDKKNIQDFVNFSVYVFDAFKKAGLLPNVKVWLTFNEPVGYALAAYLYKQLPPGKSLDINTCGIFTKNMLDAHIAVYDELKKKDKSIIISFAHMMQPINPYHPLNPLDSFPAYIFDYLLNDVALEYFKTGNFYWTKNFSPKNLKLSSFLRIGFFSKEKNPQAIGKLDFIGVNYYTHTLLKWFKESARPEEQLASGYSNAMSKKIKAIYPEGFYRSIKKAAQLKLPILITENGFASNDSNDPLRTEYIQKHLYILQKAMQEGIDIRGYLFWTLTDCFGWNSGQHSKHGIYEVNFDTQQRTLRPNAQVLIDTIKNSSKNAWRIPDLGTPINTQCSTKRSEKRLLQNISPAKPSRKRKKSLLKLSYNAFTFE